MQRACDPPRVTPAWSLLTKGLLLTNWASDHRYFVRLVDQPKIDAIFPPLSCGHFGNRSFVAFGSGFLVYNSNPPTLTVRSDPIFSEVTSRCLPYTLFFLPKHSERFVYDRCDTCLFVMWQAHLQPLTISPYFSHLHKAGMAPSWHRLGIYRNESIA